MKNTDIIGGVSPLKARQASRGGEHAGKATKTARRRGGFAKSTGARGAGGANVGGYNVNTRFTPRGEWQKPASGGTATTPDPVKPYSYTPEGELKVDTLTEYGYGPDVTTTSSTKESGGTFDEVWDANKDNFQDKWAAQDVEGDGGFAAWKNQAQTEIDAGYYSETETKTMKWKKAEPLVKSGDWSLSYGTAVVS